MNLLITNTQEDQAYLILRCLREHADRIVVTLGGKSALERWSGISAWSRHVSKRYAVPDCATAWRAGQIRPDNAPAEEEYIRRIEEICRLERIDVLVPSYDAEVYVFAKNKDRLASQGVVTTVPRYEQLVGLLDKSLTIAAAERSGFPVPATRVPANLAELRHAASEIAPPWVLKPRCNAHGVNIRLARDLDELEQLFVQLHALQERPLMQEYVHIAARRNYYVVARPGGDVVSVFTPVVRRTRKMGMRSPSAAAESTNDVPREAEVRALLKALGAWGGMTLQSVMDARDGQYKLMEINPRFGHNLWYRTELGINEPLMLVRIARGEDPGPVPRSPEGVLLLDPLWDLLHLMGQSLDQSLGWLHKRLGRGLDREQPFERESLRRLVHDLRREYFGPGQRVLSPLNRGYLSDPLPPVARIVRIFAQALQRRVS